MGGIDLDAEEISKKREKEKRTVSFMIGIYCPKMCIKHKLEEIKKK